MVGEYAYLRLGCNLAFWGAVVHTLSHQKPYGDIALHHALPLPDSHARHVYFCDPVFPSQIPELVTATVRHRVLEAGHHFPAALPMATT